MSMRSVISSVCGIALLAAMLVLPAVPALAADTVIIREVVHVDPGPPPATFGGCFISTGKGLLADMDCDKVPDAIDNCPLVPNPDQFDQTMNGVGDACDLLIERLAADPAVVLQGRSLIITSWLTNYREYDLRNLRLQVEVPVLGMLEHGTVGILPSLSSTENEVVMRIPECAMPGEYDLVLTVEYPYTAGAKEVFSQAIRIAVEESGNCPMEPTASDKTIIDIIEIQDIHPEGGVYPFTVMNNEATSKAYVLSVDGIGEWGQAQIEPGSLLVVPAGQSRSGAIRVWANEGVTGEHGFLLTIQARDDIKQVALMADVPELPPEYTTMSVLTWVFALLIVAGLIVVVTLLIRSLERKHS